MEQKKIKTVTYNKHNSFFSFSSLNRNIDKKKIIKKINNLFIEKTGLNKLSITDKKILQTAIDDLNLEGDSLKNNNFSLSKNVIDEILSINEDQILRYIVFS